MSSFVSAAADGALGREGRMKEDGGANSTIANQSGDGALEVNHFNNYQSLPSSAAPIQHRLTNLLRCLRPFPAKSVPNSRWSHDSFPKSISC